MIARLNLDPAGGEGNGESDPKEKAVDLSKSISNLIERHGTAETAIRVLLSENFHYRDQVRDLKTKLPPDGSVVLATEEAKAWQSYREFGEPREVRKKIDEALSLSIENSRLRKLEVVREASELHGYKASVLATLVEKLDLAIGESNGKDGKAAKAAQVVTKEADGKEQRISLADYAESNWQDFLPALKSDGKPPIVPTPGRTSETQPPPGQPVRDGREAMLRSRNYSTL